MLDRLAPELIELIVGFLDLVSVGRVAATCTYLHAATCGNTHLRNKLRARYGLGYCTARGWVSAIAFIIRNRPVDTHTLATALTIAVERNNAEAVRILLTSPQLDLTVCGRFVVSEAAWKGYLEILELLFADARLDMPVLGKMAAAAAARHGRVPVLEAALAHPDL